MNKRYIYLILFILLLFSVNAIILNKTEFDEGISNINTTNNLVYSITLLTNSTISSANITIQPIMFINPYIISSQIIPTSFFIDNTSSYGDFTNGNNSVDGDWNTNSQLNQNGVAGTTGSISTQIYENYTIPSGTTIANWTYKYSLSSGGICIATFDVYCVSSSGDILLTTDSSDVGLTTITTAVDESCLTSNILKMKASMSIRDPTVSTSCDGNENMDVDYYEGNASFINGNNTQFIFNIDVSNNYTKTNNNPFTVVDDAFNISNAFDEDNSTYSIFKVNASNTKFVAQSFFYENITRYANLKNGTWLSEINIDNANSTYYRTEWFIECFNQGFGGTWQTLINGSTSSNISININKNCLIADDLRMRTTLLAQDKVGIYNASNIMNLSYYEGRVRWYNDTFPNNVTIYLNNTLIYNNATNLTNSITIDLNNSFIENFFKYSSNLPFELRFDNKGILNMYDLLINYNKTTSGILTINSPNQITQTITAGNTYTTDINITNTGNSNITNITVETFSVDFVPNLNNSVSILCSSELENGTSLLCTLTLSNLVNSAEGDEILRIKGLNNDDNSLLLSTNSIDLDITVNPAVSSTGGGGGEIGNKPQTFKIVISNLNAEETKQLSISPSDKREYCLDLQSVNTNKVQEIRLVCLVPSGSPRNDMCSWITLPTEKISLIPTEQNREKFCMDITTPANIVIGDKYVVEIVGTSSIDSQIQKHKITMWVTDYSLFVNNYFKVLTEDSLTQQTNDFIRDNVSSEFKLIGINIPNYIFPMIIVNQILFWIVMGYLTKNIRTKMISNTIFYFTVGITTMFLFGGLWIVTGLEIFTIIYFQMTKR